MNINNKQYDVLDFLGVLSFAIGYLNYIENVDQSTMQNAINSAIATVQEHLENQDNKIDEILNLLKEDKHGET